MYDYFGHGLHTFYVINIKKQKSYQMEACGVVVSLGVLDVKTTVLNTTVTGSQLEYRVVSWLDYLNRPDGHRTIASV